MLKFIYVLERLKVLEIVGFIRSIIPRNNNVFVYTSFPIFSDSVWIYYEYCKAKYPYKRHIWIQVRGFKMHRNGVESYSFFSLKGFYWFTRAKVIFTNNNEFYRFKSKNQILIDFWHGIPIKSILNYDQSLKLKLPTYASGTNHRVSSSRFVTLLLSSAFGDNPKKYIESGSCRVDRILSTNEMEIKKKLSLNVNKSYAILMPTYRKGYQDKQDGIRIDIDQIRYIQNELLKNNYELRIKPHPFDEDEWTEVLGDLVITTQSLNSMRIDTCELLSMTSLLITDYSSILIDYLVMSRPFIILNLDKEKYKIDRGFIFEISDFLADHVLSNVTEIGQKLINVKSYNYNDGVYSYLRRLYFEKTDENSSERLNIYLKEKYANIF